MLNMACQIQSEKPCLHEGFLSSHHHAALELRSRNPDEKLPPSRSLQVEKREERASAQVKVVCVSQLLSAHIASCFIWLALSALYFVSPAVRRRKAGPTRTADTAECCSTRREQDCYLSD